MMRDDDDAVASLEDPSRWKSGRRFQSHDAGAVSGALRSEYRREFPVVSCAQLAGAAAHIEQERADLEIQKEFDRRVKENLARREADGRYHPVRALEGL